QARLFIDNDVMALRYLKQLRDNSNITVDEAVSIVISKFGKGAIQTIRHNDTAEIKPYDERYSELKELIHKQNDLIKGLTERLDKQQEYIDRSIKQRDKNLLDSVNELLESKKQIATVEENKSFWSRLFKR